MKLAENWHGVKQDIARACRKAARDPRDVRVVAVAKGHDFSVIRELYDLGHRDFGENYASEFAEKFSRARRENLSDIVWHFLGAIQSNKIKIIKDAHYVHSIGSVRHARMLSEYADKDINIFLQINLDNDENRAGFNDNEIPDAAREIKQFPHLHLCGLMAILPQTINPSWWFQKMLQRKAELVDNQTLTHVSLSMGMSDDFEEAILHDANFLRIGTKIFGPRENH